MDAPRCRLCGCRHYGECEPGNLPETSDSGVASKKVVRSKSASSNVGEVEQGARSPGPLTQVERNKRWREKNADRYRKSQRDLMRKNRGGEGGHSD